MFLHCLCSEEHTQLSHIISVFDSERTIARHEVTEVQLHHSEDGGGRDLVPLPENDDMVIIYNRVPKTASTSFTNIAYDLCGKNRFHVLHINTTKNNPVMSLQDQVRCLLLHSLHYNTSIRDDTPHSSL